MSPFRREILCAGLLIGFACLAGCRTDAVRPGRAQCCPPVPTSTVGTPNSRTQQIAYSPAATQPDQGTASAVRQASNNDAIAAPSSNGQSMQGESSDRLSSASPQTSSVARGGQIQQGVSVRTGGRRSAWSFVDLR